MPGFRDILAQLMAGGGGNRPAVGQDEYQSLLQRELQRYGGDRDQAVRNANIAGGFGNSTAQQFMHPAAAAAVDPMQTGALPANVPVPTPRPEVTAPIPIPTPRPTPIDAAQQAIDAAPAKIPVPGDLSVKPYAQMAETMGQAGVPHIGLSPAAAASMQSPVPVPTPRPKRAKKRSQYRLKP